MENHPDETTQTVCNGSNCLSMAEPRHKPAINKLKDTAFGSDSRVRRLIQKALHLPVPFGGAVAVIDTSTFLLRQGRRPPTKPDAWLRGMLLPPVQLPRLS